MAWNSCTGGRKLRTETGSPRSRRFREPLGTSDIQSLADIGNSYALVREMRAVPFGLEDISRLAAVTAAPLLPLLLTIFSPEETHSAHHQGCVLKVSRCVSDCQRAAMSESLPSDTTGLGGIARHAAPANTELTGG